MAKTKAEFAGASAESVAAKAIPDVKVRVLKKGDGQISTGEHDARGGDVMYEQGEHFDVGKDIADALEDRGFVEIVGDVKPAPKPAA